MGPSLSKNSTNVRFSDRVWSWVSDLTVGELPASSLTDAAACPSCGEAPVTRDGTCEQCSLEHELFHRDERQGRLPRR